MKVLITGASGFIGQFIAQYLTDNRIDVVTIGRTKPTNSHLKHTYFDLTTPDFSVCDDGNFKDIDALIHCSSIMANNSNLENFSLLNDNIKMCESVVELSRKLNIKQLINLSSFAIYPNADGHYDELSQLDVSDNNDAVYALSKICAENLYNFLLGKKNNIRVVNLRISQVYGENMRSDRTYKIMLDELREKNTITAFSDGERVSNFISVTKLTKIIHFFLNHPNYTGAYNVGGENLSYKALAEQLIEKYGNQESKIILVSRGVKSKFYLNTNKIDQILKAHGQILNND